MTENITIYKFIQKRKITIAIRKYFKGMINIYSEIFKNF